MTELLRAYHLLLGGLALVVFAVALATLVLGLSPAGTITTAGAGFVALTTAISQGRQQRDPPRGRMRVAAHRAGLHAAGLFTVFVFARVGAFG